MLERLAGVLTADEHGARDISRLLSEMRAFEEGEGFDDPQRAVQRQRQLIAELKELELLLKETETPPPRPHRRPPAATPRRASTAIR